MTNDLTINALTFAFGYSGPNGSSRREVSRGANLPEVLTVKHSRVTDKTYGPVRRSVARIDRHVLGADGVIKPVSVYQVVQVPIDSNMTTADITAVNTRMATLLTTLNTGLDLADNIFVGEEQ